MRIASTPPVFEIVDREISRTRDKLRAYTRARRQHSRRTHTSSGGPLLISTRAMRVSERRVRPGLVATVRSTFPHTSGAVCRALRGLSPLAGQGVLARPPAEWCTGAAQCRARRRRPMPTGGARRSQSVIRCRDRRAFAPTCRRIGDERVDSAGSGLAARRVPTWRASCRPAAAYGAVTEMPRYVAATRPVTVPCPGPGRRSVRGDALTKSVKRGEIGADRGLRLGPAARP